MSSCKSIGYLPALYKFGTRDDTLTSIGNYGVSSCNYADVQETRHESNLKRQYARKVKCIESARKLFVHRKLDHDLEYLIG